MNKQTFEEKVDILVQWLKGATVEQYHSTGEYHFTWGDFDFGGIDLAFLDDNWTGSLLIQKKPKVTYLWVAEWEDGATTSVRSDKNPWPLSGPTPPVRVESIFARRE